MIQDKRIAMLTLGCKVNQQETASMLTLFTQNGYSKTAFNDQADVYLINTCTVTHLGDRKSRQMIRRAVQTNPQAVVVVTGCYAQSNATEVLAIPGVDIVIGTSDRARLPELVEEARKSKGHLHANVINVVGDIMQAREFEEITSEPVQPGRVRAFLKIQEGCNQFCTYCIIPYTRGPVRSRLFDSIIQEAKSLTQAGFKEIVLTGIHTAAYGTEKPGGKDLADLVSELILLPDLHRLRISSIDPHEFGDKLLAVVAGSPKVCPHFHISLQSGCDKTLLAMHRPYDTFFYKELLRKLRKEIPNVTITTDIMVGFPGESAEDFAKSMAFAEEMAFLNMHIFKYSPRSGTPAANFPEQVSPEKKEERSKKLFSVAKRLWESYAEKYLDVTVEVLVEQQIDEDTWEGHTSDYIRAKVYSKDNLRGEIISVIVKEIGDGFLITAP